MPSLLFPAGATPRRVGTGTFTCPACEAPRVFNRVEVGRVVRLFAIRIPIGVFGEYVECEDCLSTYRPAVLAYEPTEALPELISEYQRALRRVLALLVITDGHIEQAELHTVQRVYEAVTGERLPRGEVIAEVEEVTRHPTSAASYLSRVVGFLNDHGKQQVLRGAALVSSADGHIHESEAEMVRRLGAVMRLDDDQVAAVLRDFA